MAKPVEHKKGQFLIAKILALIFSILLVACLAIPIQHARINTQQEYRDLFQYKKQAKNYYRALHSALVNLDMVSAELTVSLRSPAVSAKEVVPPKNTSVSASATSAAFALLERSPDLLNVQRELAPLVSKTLYRLQTIPDPGNGDIVDTVNGSYDAYRNYRSLLLSAGYDTKDFLEALGEAYDAAHEYEKKLQSLLF